MNPIVASLAASKELYQRSGWKGQYFHYTFQPYADGSGAFVVVGECEAPFVLETYPAYDVGFLLAHLPATILYKFGNVSYRAVWKDYADDVTLTGHSRTNPANALCRLAMELFERGILHAD